MTERQLNSKRLGQIRLSFTSETCQVSPKGSCHGVLEWSQVEQMTSSADPAIVALANGVGSFLCVAGDPRYIAAPVSLQQMSCDKQASHTYSKDCRSLWLIETAYILCVCV